MSTLAITPFSDKPDDAWHHVDGMGFYAQAKIYKTPSKFGLFGGRISKLAVWFSGEDAFTDRPCFNFSRGFDYSDFDISIVVFVIQLMEQVDGRHAAWRVANFYFARITAVIKRALAFSWHSSRRGP